MKNTKSKRGRNSAAVLAGLVALVMIVLLGLEYVILINSNRSQAERTALVLLDQVEGILRSNERKEQALIDSLKENYIAKAKAVSYIIDHVEGTETDIAELIRIAELMSIDEIHLFDETGTIYAGTVPAYYGFSFDSGEQMGWFKPMLDNKALSMCQDVTPNTAEAKSMMYAICWNDMGNRMVQIGIEPVRLLEELRTNEIDEVIESMPTYDGLTILAADAETGEILGASQSRQVGRTLAELGINKSEVQDQDIAVFKAKVERKPSYCTVHTSKPYIIGVIQEIAQVNEEVPLTMMMVFLYLLLAAVVLALIVRRLTIYILNERRNANLDSITGLQNRRAYEAEINRLEEETDLNRLVYVTMDINGLKAVNDHFGHDAGDEMIKGAAGVIEDCFRGYGTVYRIGGDEFVALAFMDQEQLARVMDDLQKSVQLWTNRKGRELSISCGSVRAEEFEKASLSELAKTADRRMYEAKAAFYQTGGRDRRKRTAVPGESLQSKGPD